MSANPVVYDAVKGTIDCLKKGEYEAAGGKLFFLWENIEYEISDPENKPKAVELVNKASALILGDDPYSPEPLRVHSLSANELAEAISYLEVLLEAVK